MNIVIPPKRKRGRPSKKGSAKYDAALRAFANDLIKKQSRMDFRSSSRGWCYLLEELISKDEFDRTQNLINDCRKIGYLPVDFVQPDETRKFRNEEIIDNEGSHDYVLTALASCRDKWIRSWTPESFWESQECFVAMLVEKIDLVTLFLPICKEYRIPIGNSKGWNDLTSRANLIRKFKYWEARGKQCILLHGGDFDPFGLKIADSLRGNFDELVCMEYDSSNLIIDRFCLTQDLIEAHNLTWINNLKTSGKATEGKVNDLANPRHKQHNHPHVQEYLRTYGARKVEANVLVTIPDVARDMCRDAVLECIDIEAAWDYEDRMEAERDDLLKDHFKPCFKIATWRELESH